MLDITTQLTTNPKQKPAPDELGFGHYFTDHMFILDYTEGIGWHDGRIVPYQPISLDPSAMIFHYGQSVFEGLKAYVTVDNEVLYSVQTKILNVLIIQMIVYVFQKLMRNMR